MAYPHPTALGVTPSAFGKRLVGTIMFFAAGLWFLLDPSLADEYGYIFTKALGGALVVLSLYGVVASVWLKLDAHPALLITAEGFVNRIGVPTELTVLWEEVVKIDTWTQHLRWPVRLHWIAIRLRDPAAWARRQPLLTRILHWPGKAWMRRPIIINDRAIGYPRGELMALLESYFEAWRQQHAPPRKAQEDLSQTPDETSDA